jgi:hypothetical protein
MRGQVKAYWYRGEGGLNFGDALNPLLFSRLAHITLEWVPPGNAELFAIGSNIEMIPDGYRGWIFGTGIAGASTRRDFSKAKVLACWPRTCWTIAPSRTSKKESFVTLPTPARPVGFTQSMSWVAPST